MNCALLLAAGSSTRFNGDKLAAHFSPTQSVFEASLTFLCTSPHVDEVYVAVRPQLKKYATQLIKKSPYKERVKKIFLGGETRFESVKNFVKTCRPAINRSGYVVIHNAANPWATHTDIAQCLKTLKKNRTVGGVGVGRPVSSTLKKVSRGVINQTIDRTDVWEMETPQVVRSNLFLTAVSSAHGDYTDDLALLEACNFRTMVMPTSPGNKKITWSEDVLWRGAVGVGHDGHAVGSSKKMKLGGITIPRTPGFYADSDGDPVLHALCNSLSSAIGEGSLGTFATKLCEEGENDSKAYVRHVLARVRERGFAPCQCSISIVAQEPRIEPFIPHIKKSVASLLKIKPEHIGVTATTGGKKSATVFCTAMVLLAYE